MTQGNPTQLYNIYLVSRTDNVDYDQYDAFVVTAENEEEAKTVINSKHDPDEDWTTWSHKVKVELIGVANSNKAEIILGSFNAG